jgi:hypothetical protein
MEAKEVKNEVNFSFEQLKVMNTRQAPSQLWLSAFEEYNRNNEIKLSINCKSCFGKVLQWVHKNRMEGQ